ncbi:allatotropin-like [Aricia agestis]|uniref:allatotropin-like n=1 Tax=Aricia agestis TaxID=91739 RepID=UPI001C208292|nr:allatotropin-like [Aricia agestis]
MNMTMRVAVAAAVALICVAAAAAAPDGRVGRKQQRPTRGFKNMEMMTARGFGKRARTERDLDHQTQSERSSRGVPTFKSPSIGIARDFGKRMDEEVRVSRGTFNPHSNILIARGFGKREDEVGMDNFWENLESSQEKDGQDSGEKTFDSIPLDWFVNEVVNNPDFARSVIRKFVDLNQDGMLSSDELLRNL